METEQTGDVGGTQSDNCGAEIVPNCHATPPDERTFGDLFLQVRIAESDETRATDYFEQAKQNPDTNSRRGFADHYRLLGMQASRNASKNRADYYKWPGVDTLRREIESLGLDFTRNALQTWRGQQCKAKRISLEAFDGTKIVELAKQLDELDTEHNPSADLNAVVNAGSPEDLRFHKDLKLFGRTNQEPPKVANLENLQKDNPAVAYKQLTDPKLAEIWESERRNNQEFADSIFGPIKSELKLLGLPDDDLWAIIQLAERAGYNVDDLTYGQVHKLVVSEASKVRAEQLRKEIEILGSTRLNAANESTAPSSAQVAVHEKIIADDVLLKLSIAIECKAKHRQPLENRHLNELWNRWLFRLQECYGHTLTEQQSFSKWMGYAANHHGINEETFLATTFDDAEKILPPLPGVDGVQQRLETSSNGSAPATKHPNTDSACAETNRQLARKTPTYDDPNGVWEWDRELQGQFDDAISEYAARKDWKADAKFKVKACLARKAGTVLDKGEDTERGFYKAADGFVVFRMAITKQGKRIETLQRLHKQKLKEFFKQVKSIKNIR